MPETGIERKPEKSPYKSKPSSEDEGRQLSVILN